MWAFFMDCVYLKLMRVISLVPSWTETLLSCEVHVVGRTRFCIHPAESVKSIPIIGGTKDWQWEKIKDLKPDLILLDQEENPKFMSEQAEIPWFSTHVTNIRDMEAQLDQLSRVLSNQKMKDLSFRWRSVCEKPSLSLNVMTDEIPGLIEWGQKPVLQPKNILYMIWKEPWMCVSRDTFIGSMLQKVGIEIPIFLSKYPEIDLKEFNPEETLILFSSEPYPFLKKKSELSHLAFPHAFVNGEYWSWFGIRSLEFLEKTLTS